MKAELNDIRLLKLAEMYEDAFERFVVGMATQCVGDPGIRSMLGQLVGGDDHGGRIADELGRLNARTTPEARADVERAALLDVCDVERAARDFYLRQSDQVHDPAVARLFRSLAQEEDRHFRIAQQALALADRKRGRATAQQGASEGREGVRLVESLIDDLPAEKSGVEARRHRKTVG